MPSLYRLTQPTFALLILLWLFSLNVTYRDLSHAKSHIHLTLLSSLQRVCSIFRPDFLTCPFSFLWWGLLIHELTSQAGSPLLVSSPNCNSVFSVHSCFHIWRASFPSALCGDIMVWCENTCFNIAGSLKHLLSTCGFFSSGPQTNHVVCVCFYLSHMKFMLCQSLHSLLDTSNIWLRVQLWSSSYNFLQISVTSF